MPTVFASVSVTVLLMYLATMGLAYAHWFPTGFHMLWGLFTAILLILLQCLIFGFFIGSGKSIKQKVKEHGLGQGWIEKTKDYKNRSYPALMLAIVVTVAAAVLGGAVSIGALPGWLHAFFIWAALFLNARSLWISYRVILDNVNGIHRMNREIQSLEGNSTVTSALDSSSASVTHPAVKVNPGANFYFLALAVWVPFLYMKFSLGSRQFPWWPFLVLSGFLGVLGWAKSRTKT